MSAVLTFSHSHTQRYSHTHMTYSKLHCIIEICLNSTAMRLMKLHFNANVQQNNFRINSTDRCNMKNSICVCQCVCVCLCVRECHEFYHTHVCASSYVCVCLFWLDCRSCSCVWLMLLLLLLLTATPADLPPPHCTAPPPGCQ